MVLKKDLVNSGKYRKILTLYFIICLAVFLMVFFISLLLKIQVLAVYHIIAILITIINIILLRKNIFFLTLQTGVIISIISSLLSGYYLGWDTNYSLYLIASVIIILYSTTLKLVLKLVELFIISALFIGFYIVTKDGFLLYSLDSRIVTVLGVVNFIICITAIGYLTYRNFSENEILTTQLKEMSEHDPLTGIYNRRFFNEYIEIEGKRMLNHIIYKTSEKSNFGIAVIDIDNFKRVNDDFGHIVGDQVLVKIVDLIKSYIFSRDIFCRYGGEEFVILFTNTDAPGIYTTLERIRKEIEIHPFHLKNMDKPVNLTVSIGFASFNEKKDVNKIIELADSRMYAAKQRGKNMVVTS